MARGFVSVKNTGLKEIAQYLDKLADKYDYAIRESVSAMQDVVVERIKTNWVSQIGGKSGGYVYDSIGKSNAMSKTDAHVVVGTMGVYHMDAVASAHGKIFTTTVDADGKVRKADMNAPQIAYFIEYGTNRLKGGTRKQKNKVYREEDLIPISAKPFLGNAFYGSIDQQNEAFKIKFNSILDEIQ